LRNIVLALMLAVAVPIAAPLSGCSLLGITTTADQNRQALTAAYATYDTTKAILKQLADNGILKGDAAAQALKYLQAASAALSNWATNPDNPNFAASAQAAIAAASNFEKSIPRPAAVSGGAS
jgi:hypothetical protein